MLQQANRQFRAGGLTERQPARCVIETGALPHQRRGRRQRRRRRVRRQARSICATSPRSWTAPEEPSQYVFFGHGAARAAPPTKSPPSPSASPSARAPTPSPWPTRSCGRWRRSRARVIPADVDGDHHPPLRRDRRGEVERTAAPHGHRGGRRVAPDPAHARLARVGHRRHRHPGHARAHAARVLPATASRSTASRSSR